MKKFIIEKIEDTGISIPSKLIYHTSNPIFRNDILKNGLIPKHGEGWLVDDNIGGSAIFAVDDIFDMISGAKMEIDTDIGVVRKYNSGYDDDVWCIDTTKCNNVWYIDKNVGNGNSKEFIYTRTKIPSNCIKLIYKGNGLAYD